MDEIAKSATATASSLTVQERIKPYTTIMPYSIAQGLGWWEVYLAIL